MEIDPSLFDESKYDKIEFIVFNDEDSVVIYTWEKGDEFPEKLNYPLKPDPPFELKIIGYSDSKVTYAQSFEINDFEQDSPKSENILSNYVSDSLFINEIRDYSHLEGDSLVIVPIHNFVNVTKALWYKDSTLISNNEILIIQDLKLSNSGNYHLILIQDEDTLVSNDFEILVSEEPIPLELTKNLPTDSIFFIGRNYSLGFKITGSNPIISWFKDGKEINDEVQTELSFLNVKPEDKGTYWAVIKSPHYSDSLITNKIKISVEDSSILIFINPDNIIGVNPNGLIEIPKGSDLKLQLSIPKGFEIEEVFYKDSNYSSNVNDSQLTIKNIIQSDTIYLKSKKIIYNLDTSIFGNGYIELNAPENIYFGDTILVKAKANTGSRFVNWLINDTIVRDSTLEWVVEENLSIVAVFSLFDEFKVTVTNSENYDISVSPIKASYVYGDSIEAIIMPKPGYNFVSWEDESKDESRTLIITSDTIISALVEQIEYSLDTVSWGNGTLQISAPSILHFADTITATAIPSTGNRFVNWRVNDSIMIDSIIRIIIKEDLTIAANFALFDQLKVTVLNSDNHTISLNPEKEYYSYGETINSQISVKEGYKFISWENGTSTPSRSIKVVSDTIISATSNIKRFFLELSTIDSMGTVTNSDSLNWGDTLNVLATPKKGYAFYKWQIDANTSYFSDTLNPSAKVVLYDNSSSIIALFRALPTLPQVSFSSSSQRFQNPINLSLSLPDSVQNAQIFFTTNGSNPDENSSLYFSPIAINSSQIIKAIAYLEGYNPSPIFSQTFIKNVSPQTNMADGNYLFKTTDTTIIIQVDDDTTDLEFSASLNNSSVLFIESPANTFNLSLSLNAHEWNQLLINVTDTEGALLNSTINIFCAPGLSQPENIAADSLDKSSIYLSWPASMENIDGYIIYENDLVIDTVTTNFYSHTSLQSDQVYSYKIRSFYQIPANFVFQNPANNSFKDSSIFSNETSARTVNTFNLPNSSLSYAKGKSILMDGNDFLIVNENYTSSWDVMVRRVSYDGQEQWANNYGDSDDWEYINDSKLIGNQIYVTGYILDGGPYLMGISSSGSLLFNKSYSFFENSPGDTSFLTSFNGITDRFGGGLVIAGQCNASVSCLISMDVSGNIESVYEYETGEFTAIDTDPGYSYAALNDQGTTALVKVVNTNFLHIGSESGLQCQIPNDILITENHEYYITGRTDLGLGTESIYIGKLNDAVDHLWSKGYSGNGNGQGYRLKEGPDGYIYASGYDAFLSNGQDAVILKVDSNGNELDIFNFGGAGWDEFLDFEILEDRSIVAVGIYDRFGSYQEYLVKMDKNGD